MKLAALLLSAAATLALVAASTDPAQSARERALTELTEAVRLDALGSGPSPQRQAPKDWVEARKTCNGVAACVAALDDQRLLELATSALLRRPNLALAEIARQEPKAAPVYEAIWLYATIDDPTERARRIEPLISPIFAQVRDKPWARPIANYPSAQALLASDQAFSRFLDVASVSGLNEYDPLPMILPCDALVRRPGLIEALDAAYGGAIDGQLVRSDCAVMAPATPRLDRLMQAAEAAQPPCRGTIRFSLGRLYEKTLDAVRLHRSDVWSRLGKGLVADPIADASFRRTHRFEIKAVRAELESDYRRAFAAPSAAAEIDAGSAVDAAIDGAFSLCETG